jgi:hypothetical protein
MHDLKAPRLLGVVPHPDVGIVDAQHIALDELAGGSLGEGRCEEAKGEQSGEAHVESSGGTGSYQHAPVSR